MKVKSNNNNEKIIVSIIVILIIIIGVFLFLKFNNKENTKEYILSTFEKEVVDTLTSTNSTSYFSTSNVEGSGYPAGYVFLPNNNFSYSHGEYSPTEEGEILSYRGTWKIENNRLILNVSEEIIAIGGNKKEDAVEGIILDGYQEKIQNVTKKYEYELNEINHDELGRVYINFKNTDINLTKISVQNNKFIDNIIKMANK